MANKVGAVAGQVVESAIAEKLPVPALNHDGEIAKKNLEVGIFKFEENKTKEIIAVRLRVKKKVQNLSAMWYKEFAKNFATQGDFGHESP